MRKAQNKKRKHHHQYEDEARNMVCSPCNVLPLTAVKLANCFEWLDQCKAFIEMEQL